MEEAGAVAMSAQEALSQLQQQQGVKPRRIDPNSAVEKLEEVEAKLKQREREIAVIQKHNDGVKNELKAALGELKSEREKNSGER